MIIHFCISVMTGVKRHGGGNALDIFLQKRMLSMKHLNDNTKMDVNTHAGMSCFGI